MAIADVTTDSEIRAAEDGLRDALLRGDAAWLEANLSADAMYVHQSGGVDANGAQGYIDRLRTGVSVYHAMSIEDVAIRRYGDTAIVTGISRSTMTYKGKRSDLAHRFTRVWVKERGKWLLATNQSGGLGQHV